LHNVLYERGLADLLDAGGDLASNDIRLTVAIPFLRDSHMRERLRIEIACRCPTLRVEMLDEVDPYTLFQRHDAFIFPYRREHSVFVPTSLLEAMSIGIPVIAADHAMYRGLTFAEAGPRCGLHPVGDPVALANVVRTVQLDYDAALVRARAASSQIRQEWTVERAVNELLSAISVPHREYAE
jgi:glycosyltransferase involved in cell wall biosynthesis